VIRSKNAGPFGLTIDILFAEPSALEEASRAAGLSAKAIAAAYAVPESDVVVFRHEASRALKVAIMRPIAAGSVGDRDIYGAQQHIPLMDVEVP